MHAIILIIHIGTPSPELAALDIVMENQQTTENSSNLEKSRTTLMYTYQSSGWRVCQRQAHLSLPSTSASHSEYWEKGKHTCQIFGHQTSIVTVKQIQSGLCCFPRPSSSAQLHIWTSTHLAGGTEAFQMKWLRSTAVQMW